MTDAENKRTAATIERCRAYGRALALQAPPMSEERLDRVVAILLQAVK